VTFRATGGMGLKFMSNCIVSIMNIVFSLTETSIDTLLTYPNIVGQRIAIKEGDKIGWYEPYIII
jgi:hypothetical protein